MSSAMERGQALRTCDRCGRTGSKAFDPIPQTRPVRWRCSHVGPCDARRRLEWRARTRSWVSRPPSSPLLALVGDEEPICVIGGNSDENARLAECIRAFVPMEVEQLDHSSRSMMKLARRRYSLFVIDAYPSDPLAYCNEISRRLSHGSRARQPLIVVVDDPTAALRGPIERLLDRPNARRVPRAAERDAFSQAVEGVLGDEAAARAVLTA